MTTKEMVAVLDGEIARLRQVRELLAGAASGTEKVQAKARSAPSGTAKGESAAKKRTLSPEARERIASAQRARWAAHTAAKTTGGDVEPGPKRGRGRPKKDAGAKKTAGRTGGATPVEGSEGTA